MTEPSSRGALTTKRNLGLLITISDLTIYSFIQQMLEYLLRWILLGPKNKSERQQQKSPNACLPSEAKQWSGAARRRADVTPVCAWEKPEMCGRGVAFQLPRLSHGPRALSPTPEAQLYSPFNAQAYITVQKSLP